RRLARRSPFHQEINGSLSLSPEHSERRRRHFYRSEFRTFLSVRNMTAPAARRRNTRCRKPGGALRRARSGRLESTGADGILTWLRRLAIFCLSQAPLLASGSAP